MLQREEMEWCGQKVYGKPNFVRKVRESANVGDEKWR